MKFAYYTSGHGFGHATRVSAFAAHLICLRPDIEICVVSTAPPHVFASCISLGVQYRYAEVDPVIVQPTAWSVDRKESLEVLRSFLSKRDEKICEEVLWMREAQIDCVLSDAVFLACAAAHTANLPSVLITNFTFDSNWSWLSTTTIPSDMPSPLPQSDENEAQTWMEDPSSYEPLDEDELSPLVERMAKDYRCANLLYLLPGAIPMPSFSLEPRLPAPTWVDPTTNSFLPQVVSILQQYRSDKQPPLYPPVLYASKTTNKLLRQLRPAPLVVRAQSPDAFTAQGRTRILSSIGIPLELYNADSTKILIVSFGGQKFKKPQSATPSNAPSRPRSPQLKAQNLAPPLLSSIKSSFLKPPLQTHKSFSLLQPPISTPQTLVGATLARHRSFTTPLRGIATPTHIYIPGAPGPVSNPSSPMLQGRSPVFDRAFASPVANDSQASFFDTPVSGTPEEEEMVQMPQLLPSGWIGIICGAGDGWGKEDLPDNLFVAPRDVYMPDLMAVGDALLGKLGYGTVSEAIDSCTAFLYVPRPAIIEEMGLKLLLEAEGHGVEISRKKYEEGQWAELVEETYKRGELAKKLRRAAGEAEGRERQDKIKAMASELVRWVEEAP